MNEAGPSLSPVTVGDYLQVLRRRALVILSATVVAAGAAIFFSITQPNKYQAAAEVYISRQNLASILTNTTNPDLYVDPRRLLQTQADIARSPRVASLAVTNAKVPGVTAGQLLGQSSVSQKSGADVLQFAVTDQSPVIAANLANAYASAFTVYRRELDTGQLTKALNRVNRQLTLLRKQGDRSSDLYKSLVTSAEQLRQMELLQPRNEVFKEARGATKVAPTPKRNGILGATFGLIIGLAAAFLWEALDKRVRQDGEVERRLALPLLSRLPAPARHLRQGDRLAMLDEPDDPFAEAIRKLRVNLEFANLDLNARAIMFTSALQQEGKSTTVANLAIALARAGRNVALVDLDLRRPSLASFFNLVGKTGITDVALGRASLRQAVVTVRIDNAPVAKTNGSPTRGPNGAGSFNGRLSVLPAGSQPANPGEFVGTEALAHVLAQLRLEYDMILIDVPPICLVGDAMSLSARVDGIIVIAKLGVITRDILDDLGRELEASPARKLGFVLTGGDRRDPYGPGGYGYRPRKREPERPSRQRSAMYR